MDNSMGSTWKVNSTGDFKSFSKITVYNRSVPWPSFVSASIVLTFFIVDLNGMAVASPAHTVCKHVCFTFSGINMSK